MDLYFFLVSKHQIEWIRLEFFNLRVKNETSPQPISQPIAILPQQTMDKNIENLIKKMNRWIFWLQQVSFGWQFTYRWTKFEISPTIEKMFCIKNYKKKKVTVHIAHNRIPKIALTHMHEQF